MRDFLLRLSILGRNRVDQNMKKLCRDKGLPCETLENSNFLKKGKIVILVKIQVFSRSRMTKRTSSLESSREI